MQPGIEAAILSNLKNSIKDNLLVSFWKQRALFRMFLVMLEGADGVSRFCTDSSAFLPSVTFPVMFQGVMVIRTVQRTGREREKGNFNFTESPLRVLTTSIPREGKVDTRSGTPNDIQICLLPG